MIPLNTLPERKASQIEHSTIIPPMYLTVQSFEYNERVGAVFYEIEVGTREDDMVKVHTVKLRYSQLLALDEEVRKANPSTRVLAPFPPKNYAFNYGNTDPHFIERRAEAIQTYLASLVRVPAVSSVQMFRNLFVRV